MTVFDSIHYQDHEQVVFAADPASGLKTIIAIHSTALGPSLGGTRFYPYATEEEALADVLRLSRGMTYKAAASGLDLGGGKAVIIGDPRALKSERLWRAYGQFVESLGGRYITAEDVGTTTADMEALSLETVPMLVLGDVDASGGITAHDAALIADSFKGPSAIALSRELYPSLLRRRKMISK